MIETKKINIAIDRKDSKTKQLLAKFLEALMSGDATYNPFGLQFENKVKGDL